MTSSKHLVVYSSSSDDNGDEDIRTLRELSTVSLTSVFGPETPKALPLSSATNYISTPLSPVSSIATLLPPTRSSSFSSHSSRLRTLSDSIKSCSKHESSDDDITIIDSDQSDTEDESMPRTSRKKASRKKSAIQKYTPKKQSTFGGPTRTAQWFKYVLYVYFFCLGLTIRDY